MKKLNLLFFLFPLFINAQDGSLDTTFGTNGKVITSINSGSDKANGVILQSDNKILVVGYTDNSLSGKDFFCIRYNSNGTLDTTFGNSGIFTLDLQSGSDDVANSIDIQNDGKIILAGYSDDGSNKNGALIRLNSNGTLDTSFGNSGKVITDFITNRADEIKVVKIHPLTGNIIVGGKSALTNTNSQIIIARYNNSGNLDSTFGNSGIRTFTNSALGSGIYSPVIEDLAVKSNGKITAVGWYEQEGLTWSANSYTVRLNSNGTLDTTFSSDGINYFNGSFNGNDKCFSLILNSDDSFIIGGSSDVSAQNYAFAVYGITNTGILATPTAQNQKTYSFNALHVSMNYALKKDNYASFVNVGSTGTSTNKSFALVKMNPDFTLDTAFGTGGAVTTTFGSNTMSEAFDTAIQNDNKILAVGYTGNDIALARYNNKLLSTQEVKQNNLKIHKENSLINLQSDKNLNNIAYKIIDISGNLVQNGVIKNNKILFNNNTKGIYFLVIEGLKSEKFINR